MSKKLVSIAAAATVLVMICQPANAAHRHRHIDKRLVAASIGVGAGMTAAFFAMDNWSLKWRNVNGFTPLAAWGATTIGCLALSPMVGSALVHRPLTMREAHVLAGSCIIPFIGGWLVEAAYDQHPEWEAAGKPRHHRRTAAR